MSLLRQGKALALTIYLGESDQWQGTSLSLALVDLLRANSCAGVTITRAIAGYGAGTRLHEQKAWQWFSEAPLIMQVADQPARLHRIIPTIQEMMSEGLITLHEVDVLAYTHARRRGISPRLPVRQVMETAVTAVELETSVGMLVELLLQAPFWVVPVVDEQNHLRGLISTGDLLAAGLLPVRRGVLRTARVCYELIG